MKVIVTPLLSFALMTGFSAGADENHPVSGVGAETLGVVHFPISCSREAQETFNQGVAMLHSFWYEEAEKTFRRVKEIDSECAMAHWGVAMSLYHQLWATPPSSKDLMTGWLEIEATRALTIKTRREKEFLAAVEAYYRDPESTDHAARKIAYAKAMQTLMEHHPEDREASVFYALALISTASPSDKTYANQKKALTLLQNALEAEPDHPGVAHYIIHSSDSPELANLGYDAARRYARIAPAVPHALHMPSHIFTRLGDWQDAAKSNLEAYRAAKEYARRNRFKGIWDQQMHSMDYLMYAYLQSGEFGKAYQILKELKSIKKAQPESTTSAYAFAAIPARFALERRKWSEAAGLRVEPTDFPWKQYGWCEAVTHFARGLGAARIGQLDDARASLDRLQSLQEADRAANQGYFADQIEIQRLAVSARIALAEGNAEQAERQMRTAAELEDSTEKDNVTPGPIVPARELLGEMLLELKRPGDALKEFEASLKRNPNRLNGVNGATRAVMLAHGTAPSRADEAADPEAGQ